MGLMQKRKKRERIEATPANTAAAPKVNRAQRRAADELDELIEYGRAALTAPGSAPLAMQLDTALRVAGLYLRRADKTGAPGNAEDLRFAAKLASFVAERSADTPPAAVIELGSRAVAVLEVCSPQLPDNESVTAQSLATRTRERVERAEHVCAVSLDEAIASLTIGKALLAHAPAAEDRDVVVSKARSLLMGACIAARRAGNDQLANAALTLVESTNPKPAEPEPPKRRGLRRK